MELKPAEAIDWTLAGDEHFTGEVWFGPLSHATPEGLEVLAVHFVPGARTDWHTHPEGQVLYCVSGAGRVQNDDGETVTISPGDVVYDRESAIGMERGPGPTWCTSPSRLAHPLS